MRLGVNIDHIATLRQARRADVPDPVQAAVLAELAGADGITVHIRQDRRHIQDRDIRVLRDVVKTRLNVEMALREDVLALILDVEPHQVTIVPERPDELTTEGGLDVPSTGPMLSKFISALNQAGVHVSVFIDPDVNQIWAARDAGADAIEICTARYSEDPGRETLTPVREAAAIASEAGLSVHAGHGLNYQTVSPVAAIAEIVELNIGHSIVARAALVGIERAVREMKQEILKARLDTR